MDRHHYAPLTLLAVSLQLGACLPTDTRPVPATVELSVDSDDSLRAPMTSSDGWTITFERFLVVLGHGTLAGDDCDAYSEADFDRIIDVQRTGWQRVNLLYGRGRCSVAFAIAPPAWDTLRGDGVSSEDEAVLRTPGSDFVAREEQGASIRVEGRAQNLEVTKRFAWSFRRFIHYENCEFEGETQLALTGHENVEVELSIGGAVLFQDGSDSTSAVVRFDPFRDADEVHGNADGLVALDELERTPIDGSRFETLGELVYLELLPEIMRYRGTLSGGSGALPGACEYRAASGPMAFDDGP
jgi:hypothetical protein